MKHIASWTEPSSENESKRLITELALSHAHFGGHQGTVIADLINSGSYLELCGFELDYSLCTVPEARNCRQALAFYKKCTYLPLGGDRKDKAKKKFELAEENCRQTNEAFALRDQGLFNFEPWVDVALKRASTKISRVLGRLPNLSELKFKFGPGATTLTKKRYASVAEKLSAGFSCSEDLLPYASRILEEMPVWFNLHQTETYEKRLQGRDSDGNSGDWVETYGRAPVFVTPGRVNFVPKDALTDRTVIVEGSLNVIVQGAIGRYMFRRLQASGIDLSDQTNNQMLAKEGSLTGALATLDLVSASDMMSIGIVKELLPWEWYFFLSTMRSSEVTLDDATLRLHKFSSMGNGFTFPLQSLIFWALVSSVDSLGTAAVYGDDIVCHTTGVERVMRLLNICGFDVNRKKSYWTGSFRESCGSDWLSGINIRPWYHREVLRPMDLFRLHNFYVRQGDLDRAALIRQHINPSLLIYGPDGYGDGHLLGDWIPRPHKRATSHGYGGVLFDTFRLKPIRDKRFGRKGDRVLPYYTIYTRESGDAVLPELSYEEGIFERRHDALKALTEKQAMVGDPADHGSTLRVEDVYSSPERLASYLRIRRKMASRMVVEALPEGYDKQSGVAIKHPSLPGTHGYVRVSIYTFNAG